MELLTPSNITFALGILSVIFSVFFYFRKPQEETETKAALLAQQVVLEREMNEKKFIDVGVRLDGAFTLAQNHIHTLDTKIDTVTNSLNTLGLHVEKLSTIIEERIPRK